METSEQSKSVDHGWQAWEDEVRSEGRQIQELANTVLLESSRQACLLAAAILAGIGFATDGNPISISTKIILLLFGLSATSCALVHVSFGVWLTRLVRQYSKLLRMPLEDRNEFIVANRFGGWAWWALGFGSLQAATLIAGMLVWIISIWS